MSAMSRLPEELLRDILNYLISIDEETFCDFPRYGWPRWRKRYRGWLHHQPASRLNCLRVCKQWLRIGTPLLYEKVILWETSKTKAVAQLVKANPNVGRAIRYLRLEGGMGRDLLTICKHAPNVHTLWITPHIRGTESVVGLRKAIALLQPRKVYLFSWVLKNNKASEEAQKLITSGIAQSWTSLASITLHEHSSIDNELSHALQRAPALKTISTRATFFFEDWVDDGFFATVAANETLEQVIFKVLVPNNYQNKLVDALKRRGLSERAINLFKFVQVKPEAFWPSVYMDPEESFVLESDASSGEE